MTLQIHTPSYPLNEFIGAIVYYDGLDPAHQLDRFLPDGNTELIINLDEKPQYIYDNETLAVIQTCRHAWVSGVRTRPITIPSGRGSKMLIVAFRKGKSHPFYPLPVNELRDIVLEADLVFGKSVLDLREQLLACPSIGKMFCLLEQFLLRLSRNTLSPDSASRCIEYALSSIILQPGIVRLPQLSDQIGYSQKHLIGLFKKQVGIPPMQYVKIMRFQKIILELEKKISADWSSIALQNGFYDQSHFIHEFRNFSGFTPGEYLQRKGDTLNYVPVL
jgi:AraC-like DNA-binding protein